jgi:DNA-directed RNA polymerase I subunit RPA2
MASKKPKSAQTERPWTVEYDTVRRQKLFQNPPTDKTAYPTLAEAIHPHVHSFNAIFEPGGLLDRSLLEISNKSVLDGNPNPDLSSSAPPPKRNRISYRLRDITLGKPYITAANKHVASQKAREIMPSECRDRHCTYKGKLSGSLEYRVNNGDWKSLPRRELGQVPIMLRSNKCYLEKLTPAQLVGAKEETDELGGYFIVNGNEKLIRMLIAVKRNFPIAIVRPSFKNRGGTYTEFGVQIRSVRPDETSHTNVLHYLSDGNIIFRFSWRKNEYLMPFAMIAKALVETSDRKIFEAVVGPAGSEGLSEKQFVMDRIEMLLRTYKRTYNIHGKKQTRTYIGEKYRVNLGVSDDLTDEEAGTEFLRKIVLPHLGCTNVVPSQDEDKFNLLMFMARKLYALVQGDCAPENPDAASCQEILLPGFLYGMLLKEKIEEYLMSIRRETLDQVRRDNYSLKFTDPEFEKTYLTGKILKNAVGGDIGTAMEYFLSTGNLISQTGLDLQQVSGFTVVAEKINFYRFISHFRMVHRGSFFAQMKTTTVRKLLPESWGFLCPVHTPDGAPCGLLNHLAHKCKIATKAVNATAVPDLVAKLGVTPIASPLIKDSVVVQLDGRILGYCSAKQALTIHDSLRYWKVEGTHNVPAELEIGYVPVSNGGQFPGVYMFSGTARMYRPVKYLPLNKTDYVGPLEQPFMSIAVTEQEIISGETTHCEYSPTNILSIVANQTPFSDFNQSPRNMYQCQMGKQTMGTYGTAIKYRTDNKAYRLQTGQTPVVRAPLHNEYGLDNFPNGTNAVVAVISYTGYDMDDAMIINKSAHERGFGHGTIYKTEKITIAENQRRTNQITKLFGFNPGGLIKADAMNHLDADGLPHIGKMMQKDDPVCAYYEVEFDTLMGKYKNKDDQTIIKRWKDDEIAFVEDVRLLGAEEGNKAVQTVSIKFRIPRAPVIGDKFSSRHGQKGVCSQKWPQVDMPFTESGIQPDVIINPHAFPSRMTIGMFVESLAGKAGALHGLAQESTPWQFDEKDTAVDYFGHQLMKAGFNYYGNEPMYSGITGTELAADIYIGVVYYQRLRHMVNDKFQVRTTGPVNKKTGQPIKGRKKGGGIRVGEMERDALLAHGAAFLLQDRLLNCSDYQMSYVCRNCGCFLSTTPVVSMYGRERKGSMNNVRCRACARQASSNESRNETWQDAQGNKWVGGEDVSLVAVPGVLRYLDVELASMGVKMKFSVSP